MPIWPWITIVIAIAVAACLLSDVTVKLFVSRATQNDRMFSETRALFGLIRYRSNLSGEQVKKLTEAWMMRMEKAVHPSSPASRTDLQVVQHLFRNIKQLFTDFFGLSSSLDRILSKVRCVHLSWTTWIGLEGAPETAVGAGVVWALKSSLLGFIFSHIQLATSPHLQVVPQYNRMQFSSEVEWVARVRLGYALLAAYLVAGHLLKSKAGYRLWKRQFFKAS